MINWIRSLFTKSTTRKTHIHLNKETVRDIEHITTVYPDTDLYKLAKKYEVSYSTIRRIAKRQHKHSSKS